MEFKFYFHLLFPTYSRFISDPHRTKKMLSSADDRRTFTNKLHRLKGDLDYFMGRIEAPYNDVTETDKKRYCSVIIEMMEFLVKRIENVSTVCPLIEIFSLRLDVPVFCLFVVFVNHILFNWKYNKCTWIKLGAKIVQCNMFM